MVTFVVLVGGLGVLSVAPASGQEPSTTVPGPGGQPASGVALADDVAAAIAADGWFADRASTTDPAALAALAGELSSGSDPVGFALLAQEPDGSSTVYAEQVLDALPAHGELGVETVAVLSPEDVGVVSDTWDDAAIDAALDSAIDDLRADPVVGLETLTDALASQPTMAERDADDTSSDSTDDTGGGVSSAWLVLGVIGLIAAVVIGRLFPGRAGYGDDEGWDSSDYRRRSRWRRTGRSSLFGGSRRSGASRSRRSSGGSRRRGRGGRRL